MYNLICTLKVILGEEVAASKLTLFDITKQICDAVQARAGQGLKQFKLLLLSLMVIVSVFFFFFLIIIIIIIIFLSDIFCGPDKNHGVILLPEGLIESIPEIYALLKVT
jgi:pyrophosphate--fructose-6-phosphate 1-phosphotransferase